MPQRPALGIRGFVRMRRGELRTGDEIERRVERLVGGVLADAEDPG
jgi:hypothetical protein